MRGSARRRFFAIAELSARVALTVGKDEQER